MPVCVPGLRLRRGARARRRAGAHGRRRARLRGAAAVEEQTPHRHQHDHRATPPTILSVALPAAPLRVSLRLPSGSELRQVSISGSFGHPGDEPIGCPTIRRRGRPGCRSRSPAPVRTRTAASRSSGSRAPATITSPRPGAMTGSAARSGVVMPARSSSTRSARPSVSQVRWIASGSYAVEAERDRLERRRGPGHGDQRARVADRHVRPRRRRAPRRPRSRAARARRATEGRDARTARSGARCPSASRSRAPRGPARRPTTNSVEPPPMSSTRYGGGAGRGSSPCVPPRNDRPASRSPLITSSSLPRESADGRGELLAVLRVADGARGRDADALGVQGAGAAAEASEHLDRARGAPPGRTGRSDRRPGRAA